MLISQINHQTPTYEVAGFYDDNEGLPAQINGAPYRGGIEQLNQAKEDLAVAIAIGNPGAKRAIRQKLHNPKLSFPNLVHPTIQFDRQAQRIEMGEGNLICQGTILTCNIVLGSFITLNLSCTVGHDAQIGDYCSFMPDVNISGETQLGEGIFAGTNSSVINGVSIGSGSVLGAGACAVKDLPEKVTAVGVPAKIIKHHE